MTTSDKNYLPQGEVIIGGDLRHAFSPEELYGIGNSPDIRGYMIAVADLVASVAEIWASKVDPTHRTGERIKFKPLLHRLAKNEADVEVIALIDYIVTLRNGFSHKIATGRRKQLHKNMVDELRGKISDLTGYVDDLEFLLDNPQVFAPNDYPACCKDLDGTLNPLKIDLALCVHLAIVKIVAWYIIDLGRRGVPANVEGPKQKGLYSLSVVFVGDCARDDV